MTFFCCCIEEYPNGYLTEHIYVHDLIQNELDDMKWSYKKFAEKAGRPLFWVKTIMKGEKSLSQEDVNSIEKALQIRGYLSANIVNLEDRR
ncbi:hypothetical protein [Candidatus Liberibacter sp.]|uniref:hypothetical protein n=1 Tax=Candidatus Liberibacter sp. TaxID=34022 RepID=UPI0015F3674D|nr:hypothetical protein [Candidatus Liberibacter sp.]MBA5724600.1 hypothetical protein [Candidatus Liberibacter sp.]